MPAGDGSWPFVALGLAIDAVTFDGSPALYPLTTDGGYRVVNGFCAACGSPLFRKSERHPHLLFVHAAALDDPSPLMPEKAVWTEEAQPWDFIDEALDRE